MTVTVSEMPWSKYTAADYDVPQWCKACLIHQHEGPATSKTQCKLPVRTPDGTLNRSAVHAAAAALAGARGGVGASVEEKSKATRALAKLYSQLDEKPPPSIKHDSVVDFLSHKVTERTVDDIINKMTPEQYDFMTLIVGAAFEDVDISMYPEIQQEYDNLSPEHKNVIDFIVGGLLADDTIVKHQDLVGEFLAHHGVKGQRWGIRARTNSSSRLSKSSANTKEGRAAARAAVKGGRATLGEAHLAGLKSTGHRVINAFLGDKTYWKRTAIIAGVAVAGLAASALVPAVLPAAVLSAVGAHAVGTSGVAGGHVVVSGTLTSTAAIGQATLTHLGVVATGLSTNVAGAAVSITNLGRAVRGNLRIDKSHAALGKLINDRQTAGTKRVNKILNKSGSIGKNRLEHGEQNDDISAFLAHHGVKGMRWGIRRERSSDGTVSGGSRTGDTDEGKTGTGGGHGGTSGQGDHLSADAERFIKTQQKKGHEMSDREIKEAVNRANMVKQYNDAFSPKPNHDLQNQVEKLRLEKEYGTLKAELHPSAMARVGKLVKFAVKGYEEYAKLLDTPAGKKMNSYLSSEISSAFATASAQPRPSRPSSSGAPTKVPFVPQHKATPLPRKGSGYKITRSGKLVTTSIKPPKFGGPRHKA